MSLAETLVLDGAASAVDAGAFGTTPATPFNTVCVV